MAKFITGVLITLLTLAGFLLPQPLFATAPLLISQVQIASETSTKHDFIKIYNSNDFDIDLEGYRLVKRTKTGTSDSTIKSFNTSLVLPAKTTLTWANNEDGFADSIGADTSTSQSLANDNAVALRFGAEDSGDIIDAVAWGEADNGLVEGSRFPTNPGKGQVLSRRQNLDTDNNASDFELGGLTSIPNNAPDSNPETSAQISIITQQKYQGLVYINEFVSSPASGETEWIELFNNSSDPIDLQNWTIEDGSGAKTVLQDTIINYLVIDSPKGNLNNAGDIIILKDSQAQIIDEITYGEWQNTTSPHPAPSGATSLARHPDNLSQWSLTTTPTLGQINLITEALLSDDKTTEDNKPPKPCSLVITEVLPNPQGADSEPIGLYGEFIELYNRSDASINLLHWRLLTDVNKSFKLPDLIIPAHSFIQLTKRQFKFSLPNLANTLKLYEPDRSQACFQVKYPVSNEAISWNLDFNTLENTTPTWLWSLTPSPGRANQIQTLNSSPIALINYDELNPNHFFFDGTASYDPDNHLLTYHWDFDDSNSSDQAYTEHYFNSNGTYQVKLTVSDGHLQHSQTVTININNHPVKKLTPTPLLSQASNSKPIIKVANTKTTPVKKVAQKSAKPVTITSTKTTSSNLTLSGTVIVEPNSFGSQYFYIFTDTGEAWQIYRQKADWPKIELGQIITATGKKSPITTARRLLISDLSDIELSEIGPTIPAISIKTNQASAYLDRLVTVTGQITDRQGDSVYLDDGQGEIMVRFKTATTLNAKNFNLGSTYTVTGLLLSGTKELELWPRSVSDTNLLEQVLGEKITATSTSLNIAERPESQLSSQLLVASAVIIIILIILLIKSFYQHKSSQLQ